MHVFDLVSTQPPTWAQAQNALRQMQKEAEDPDKELQEEFQKEEDAIKNKKQSQIHGRGRARGRGRGRSRGRGRGAKAAAAVEQVAEEKPKNKPAQKKKNEPAQKKNEPAQKTAEDASCSVSAETPHHPCDPAAPNQNDDGPSMVQKPRTAVRRKNSRSKLKRLKHMSPSSSAKKKQRQETGESATSVQVDDSQVDQGEPVLQDSQEVPSLPPAKRPRRRKPVTRPSTIPPDGWPEESLEEEPENNVKKDEGCREKTEKDALDKEELKDKDADSDGGSDKGKEKDQAALIAKDPTIKCIKWSLSKTSQHVLWRNSRFVHCSDFVS